MSPTSWLSLIHIFIELRFVKGMTQIEIAKKLGISQVQVSRLLRRTLKKIQDKIDPDGVMVRS